MSPLNRLSPRTLPYVDFLSSGVGGWLVDPPSEKFPKVPIGKNPADCGPVVHGEEGPFRVDPTGPVTVRFKPPKGLLPSSDFPSFSSSSAEPRGLSLKSVLRRRREGGGVGTLSSLPNLLPMVGDVT